MPEPQNYIAPVTLRLYAGIEEKLNPKAVEHFEKRITGYMWLLREDGAIISGTMNDRESIQLAIDTEDAETIKTFNHIPDFFKRKIPEQHYPEMRLSVSVYISGDTEYPFWTPDDNTDVILFNSRGMYVSSVWNMWELTSGVKFD